MIHLGSRHICIFYMPKKNKSQFLRSIIDISSNFPACLCIFHMAKKKISDLSIFEISSNFAACFRMYSVNGSIYNIAKDGIYSLVTQGGVFGGGPADPATKCPSPRDGIYEL